MGTNYDAIRYNPERKCKHCHGTGWETIATHIGKSSWGWTFSFHAASIYDLDPNNWGPSNFSPIESYASWLEYLQTPGIKIVDEYGDEHTLEDFKKLVEEKREAKMNHTIYVRQDASLRSHADECFLDEEGNSFSRGEFS